MRISPALLFACLVGSSPALASPESETRRVYSAKELAKIGAITPADFRQSATVADDQLEPVATIATAKGFSSYGRFTDRVKSDNFFRAMIDKGSGTTIYQLYTEVTYNFAWRNFSSASVMIGGRPQSLSLTVISREMVTCAYGSCAYRETVAIPLTEAQLREIATAGSAGPIRLWPYRLKAQNGVDFEDAAIPAEAAGLLLAVETYRQRIGLTPTSQP